MIAPKKRFLFGTVSFEHKLLVSNNFAQGIMLGCNDIRLPLRRYASIVILNKELVWS